MFYDFEITSHNLPSVSVGTYAKVELILADLGTVTRIQVNQTRRGPAGIVTRTSGYLFRVDIADGFNLTPTVTRLFDELGLSSLPIHSQRDIATTVLDRASFYANTRGDASSQ